MARTTGRSWRTPLLPTGAVLDARLRCARTPTRIYYYADPLAIPGNTGRREEPEWELFDLQCDPCEMHSVYGDPRCAALTAELTDLLHELQAAVRPAPRARLRRYR